MSAVGTQTLAWHGMPGSSGPQGLRASGPHVHGSSELVDGRVKVEVEVVVAVPRQPRTGSWGFVELAKYVRYPFRKVRYLFRVPIAPAN